MELSDLIVFKAVVESGGISGAAHILHRVPSNVTARIQKLESELDKPLFIREKNRLRVSPAGEQFLEYAERILKLADEAVISLHDQEPSGKLKVGCMEAVAASRLSPLLLDFHRSYQKVELEISTNPTGLLIDQVLDGYLDLALVADPVPDSRLEITPVFLEHLVIVSSKQYDQINHPKDLGKNPTLLGFSSRCAYRNRLSEWASQADTVAKVVEINSYHALLNCATAGMGVGIVPEILLEFYPFKGDLNVHEMPLTMRTTKTSLIWRKDSIKTSMNAFKEMLMNHSNL